MSRWFDRFGFAEIADNLVIGAYPQDADDVAALHADGITRVLNLVQDIEYEPGARDACAAALERLGIQERRIELVDYGGLMPEQLERAAQEVLGWLDAGERVYLHCRAGWQRSAAVAAAIVALREGVGLPEALEMIRARKPTADPLPHQRMDLAIWWRLRERGDLEGASEG